MEKRGGTLPRSAGRERTFEHPQAPEGSGARGCGSERKLSFEWGATKNGITFRTLRHTMASLGRNAGIPSEMLAKMGNWKDRRMVDVDRYAKFSDESFREAAGKLAQITGGKKRTRRACHTVSQSEQTAKAARA